MKPLEIETTTPAETQRLAKALAVLLAEGDVISLTGDLGAGKTCFVKGLAAGLRIDISITSPTFNLIKEYRGRMPLYHFDVFRLNGPEDLFDLGYEDYFYGTGVTVIEWGDKVERLLPPDHLEIEFHRLAGQNDRRLIVQPHGASWERRVKEWLKDAHTGA